MIQPTYKCVMLDGCCRISAWRDAYLKENTTNFRRKISWFSSRMCRCRRGLPLATAEVSRLQGAIKYPVTTDLLFSPGGWRMRPQGKQIIAKMASRLAPTQRSKLLMNGYTDNVLIGPGSKQRGITSNQVLSEMRATSVMEYLARRET
jgi:flagellar motor protein MotB